MGVARILGHAKRKARVILIFIFAVTFTATIAFYNAQQVTSSAAARRVRPVTIPIPKAQPEENNIERIWEDTEKKVEETPPNKHEIEKEKAKEVVEKDKDIEEAEEEASKEKNTTFTMTSRLPMQVAPVLETAHSSNSSSMAYPPLQEFAPEFDTSDIYRLTIGGQKPYSPGKTRNSVKQKLKVFILPFTHVDPGWLKTFDAYSEDTNKILTNMHSFMTKNKAMRFMWAEFVFFERWWKMQNDTVKDDVRGLVKEGRLELASGSWVMTDEANAYFPVSVDNIVEGHQFLHREFGIQPSTIWSNDPFGYSNSVPYIFRQAGIKRNVINRIHHGIKGYLQGKKAIPFQWKQYFDKTGADNVLTQVLPYTHYDILNSCGPSSSSCCEFDFKRMTHWSCPGSKPVPITPENVRTKAHTLVSQLESMATMYEAPVILQMHGDDFRFDMIEEWHQHHDNFLPLFEEINKGESVQIRFGTFTDYFNELEKWYKDQNVQPATLTGDFFPYKCALGDLWTGYFTTRPFYKRQGRLLHTLIRAADVLSSQAQGSQKADEVAKAVNSLETARRTLSLFQHHDAITGTSKIHVMKDYSKLLFEAQTLSNSVVESSFKTILSTDVAVTHSAALFNETQTKHQVVVDGRGPLYVTVFNPLPYSFMDTVSLRVNTTKLSVTGNGEPVNAQIEPYIYKGEVAQDSYLLTIPVKLVPVGISVYEIKAEESKFTTIARVSAIKNDFNKIKAVLPSVFKLNEITGDKLKLETGKISTKHHEESGVLQEIKTAGAGVHRLTTAFVAYSEARGGAYLMRVSKEPQIFAPKSVPKMLVSGPVQQSLHSFMGKIYQRVTAKEIEGQFGEQLDVHLRVDITAERNTEVALLVKSDIKGAVFADSVGLQLLHRETSENLEVAANYYPMPSSAVVENNEVRLTVSSNVEHGMMPLEGGFEIMLDRMLNQDDGKGLGSSDDAIPKDLLPVDIQFAFRFDKMSQNASTAYYSAHTPSGHVSVQNILYPPIVAVSSEKPQSQKQKEVLPLPCDYQLLTVRPVDGNKRLITIFRNGIATGASNSRACGSDVTASLRSLLSSIGATHVQHANLAGTIPEGTKLSPSELVVKLEPFRFLSLLATISA